MKIVIDIPEEVKQAFDNADDINFSYYDFNSVIGKAIRNATPLTKVLEEEYRRGWEDAICKALKETHDYYTEDGVFRAIQEESLIGVGMIMDDKHISGKEQE